MPTTGVPSFAVVVAAQSGDRSAIRELVTDQLPLIYNLIGRAAESAPVADEAMRRVSARIAGGLPGLDGPEQFRAWLVASSIEAVRSVDASLCPPSADPEEGFEARAIATLGLTGQRREAVEAIRWMAGEDRELVALWWLQVAGELTRDEVVAGLGLTSAASAVRQVEARFEDARTAVRALNALPRCGGLAVTIAHWDGRPSERSRRQIVRHTQGCAGCAEHTSDLIPADRLVRGFALVPPPEGLAARLLDPARARAAGARRRAALAWLGRSRSSSWVLVTIRTAAVALAAAVLAGGLLAYARARPDEPPVPSGLVASPTVAAPAPVTPPTEPSPSASAGPSVSPRASKSPGPTKKATVKPAAPPPSPPALLGARSLRSVASGAYVRAIGRHVFLTPVGPSNSDLTHEQATLVVVPGLADGRCYSFRDSKGRYLRHFAFRVQVDPDDGTDLFREDTTFCAIAGGRFRSHNFPDRLLHTRGEELGIDPDDGTAGYRKTTVFAIRAPWVNES
ncbi:AbfB domain-containing protein [Cryptosporangium sp. NPDC051539]|uniref:AbfB domain-containing protein n=1 Tax=Cryptosporangium sp. NPDC051539 TaxID=3363962 RepID=UPI003790C86F